MSPVEVLADDDSAVRTDATLLRWPTHGIRSAEVLSDLDWNLTAFGAPTPVAADLARVAVAAYLADRAVRRSPTYFSRRLELVVHVDHPASFLSPAGQRLADLLAWLTGDAWTLTPVQNASPSGGQVAQAEDRDVVMLLSGGLDSLCGAIVAFGSHGRRLHLGHRDQTGAVVRCQDRMATTLLAAARDFAWQRVRLAPAATRENSTRTRSLMFMALAVAAASGSGAKRVAVPENGFTSLNLPLLPSRGGALSTKSTHPWTFRQMNLLLEELELDVQLDNPHGLQTKGELLRDASQAGLNGFTELVGASLSCSKLDGGLGYEGGSPNVNCGLCVACLVRRGAFVGAGIPDPTDYLLDRVTARGRAKLIRARAGDVWAIRSWGQRELDVDDLIVSAPWPPGTEYEAMLDIVRRGRTELLGALDVAL